MRVRVIGLRSWRSQMTLSETFRENATNCAQLAEKATSSPAIARYGRMEKGWLDLAAEQDWLTA
jgi:hypothetical protein